MSVFASFIYIVPNERPKTAKRASAELGMAVLTLLKEHNVCNLCDRSCFVAHLAEWECSIWQFGRFWRLGPTLGFQGTCVPQTKPIPLLVTN